MPVGSAPVGTDPNRWLVRGAEIRTERPLILGVLNLTPDKQKTLGEMFRVLRPGGRLQIGDILVNREVSQEAKRKIDLWTG